MKRLSLFLLALPVVAICAITPPPSPPITIFPPDLPTPEEREAARRKAAAQRQLRAALASTIQDTRTNIVETAELTDEQIAGLYLRQMKRDVSPLVGRVPTNTVEYLIGAGMRIDIAEGSTNAPAAVAPETSPAED
jgi:hypothetical protein